MRPVPVTLAWMVNSFENSSEHSEYYLDAQTGDVSFLSPMDFPEHEVMIKKFNKNPERYIPLPKLEQDFALKTRQDYLAKVADPYLKGLLEKATDGVRFRNVLMEYEEARRQWYKFQNDRYAEFLKEWFREKGIELVDNPPENVLEYNRGR